MPLPSTVQRGLDRAMQLPPMRRAMEKLSPERARRHTMVGPTHRWKMKRDFQIAFLKDRGLQPHNELLDLGCGTLRGGLPLIDYLETGHYCGVEARPEVLEEGRVELRNAGLEGKSPQLIALGDDGLAGLQLDRTFDFIWAFSVLIHMADEILEQALAVVGRCLTADGSFYANVNIGDNEELAWQGFPVVSRELAFYEAEAARHGLSVAPLGTLGDLGHPRGARGDDQVMLQFRRSG